MFCINDQVRYGAKGIFRVEEILYKKNKEGKRESWYVLHSIKEGVDTKITTPSHNPFLRRMLSRKDFEQLLAAMPTIKPEWIEDKNTRYQKFKDILDSNDPYALVHLIKTIYLKKLEKKENKKMLADKDKEILEAALHALHEECSLAFSIREQDVPDFILQHLS